MLAGAKDVIIRVVCLGIGLDPQGAREEFVALTGRGCSFTGIVSNSAIPLE